MKLSDYLLDYLVSLGVKHVFLLTGGAILFAVDSFREKKGIEYVCVMHEQAGAMAAEAYTRVSGKIGVTMATSGPGATNLITGICCAYFDSIPMLCITGQVNTFESKGKGKVRQVGFQETDIVEIAKPVTKFAAQVTSPKDIRYLLEKAVYLANSGRPGPVLLDLPVDMQRAEIVPEELRGFEPKEEERKADMEKLEWQADEGIALIEKAKRPIILLGGGVKLAGAQKEAREFVEKLGFPFVLSWSAMDLFPDDNRRFAGSFGVSASRAGNFAVQNSDLLIVLGSRLDTRQTGGKPQTFAREAKKIIVDIDEAELNKGRGLVPDIPVNCDLKLFLQLMNKRLDKAKKPEIGSWLKRISGWRAGYPVCPKELWSQKESVNPYVFMQVLSEEAAGDEIVIPDIGNVLCWTMQGFKVKGRQALFSAFGHAPMGYSLPAGIGTSFAAAGKRPVVCIAGDGGMQINVQELQTVHTYKLPIKIFVINNQGYGIIRQFQDVWLEGKHEASCPEKGLCFPDFAKVAKSYGLKTETIKNHAELRKKIRRVLDSKEAVLCDVKIKPNEKVAPKVEFGKPIEDASPLLGREEFLRNMIVKPFEGK